MMNEKKGKWVEVSLSVREVDESEVPEEIRNGSRTPSASRAYREGYDRVFGKKEDTHIN